ncbi:Rhodopsin kinase [Clarias magur]|uniref:Rhodopsin kinase n=1 Tax=Clarias magur TaxID=1594786 RepID=A0A8J4UM18_CLAMG|nr:Rhodopsin kinase [Clarias magur]
MCSVYGERSQRTLVLPVPQPCELKQRVLRTISRMLQENRSIREQRGLGYLRQAP